MPEEAPSIMPPTSFTPPRWSRPFSFLTRHIKGWNFLLFLVFLPLAIAAVSAPPAAIYEMCEGDGFINNQRTLQCLGTNGVFLGLLEAIAGLIVLMTFMLLGSGFAWSGHRHRARQLRRAYEKRIQSLRDHVIAGSATPESFDEVQRIWKPLVRGDHPAVRAQAGTSSSIVFNVLVSLAFGVGLTIYVIGLLVFIAEGPDSDTDEAIIIWNSIFIPLLVLHFLTMVWGWIQFPRAHAQAVHANHDAVDAAERTEIRVFAPATTRRSRTAVASGGPSFSPYAERSRMDEEPGTRALSR